MAKKYWEGDIKDININTDWGGDESTSGAPLPGSIVQKIIKNELNTKVGYMVEDGTTGQVKFFANESDYISEKKPIGSVTSAQRYSMLLKFDSNNKYVFFSNEKNKEIVWYFKTLEVATDSYYSESVTVNYTINTNNKVINRNIVIDSDGKSDEEYTKVVINLDEYLEDGISSIDIDVTGLKTKQKRPLQTSITIITFEMEDKTIFNKPFNDIFYIVNDITCTNGQSYHCQYRLNDATDWIKTSDVFTGNSNKQNITVNVPISNLEDGKNIIEYRMFVNLGTAGIFYTDIQRIEFIKGENNKFNEPQILVSSTYSENDKIEDEEGNLIINGVLQYVLYDVKYSIFDSDNREGSTTLTFYEILSDSDKEIMSITVNNETSLVYTVQYVDTGLKGLKIIAKNINGDILNGNGRTIYLDVKKSDIAISLFNTNLRFDITSIGKDKNDRTWISNVGNGIPIYKATFSDDYDWSQGWTDDGLVVSKGEIIFDYAPFPVQKDNPSASELIEYVGGERAFSMEIEFKTQNVTNEDAIVCDMLSERTNTYMGLQITGTEFKFLIGENTGVSSRFKSGEMNRFALVFRPRKSSDGSFKGLIELYNNGILSNITKYDSTTKFELYEYVNGIGQSKRLRFKGGEGSDIVIKYVRTYNGVMEPDNVVDNYIIYRPTTSEMLSLYNKNNVINENGNITPESVIKLGNIPVLIFIGRTNENLATGNNDDVIGDDGKPIYTPSSVDSDDSYWYETLEQTTDKKKSVEMDVIYYNPMDKSKNFKFVKAYITPQGTSSMYYPKKNYRIYTQKTNTRMFLSIDENNPLEYVDMIKSKFGENETDRIYEKYRGLDKKTVKKRVYSFKDNAQPVKCWCLKADFAETSSSHNTGIGRLWGDVLRIATAEVVKDKNITVFKTNAQELTEIKYNFNINGDMPDVRTTIDGFPIVVFGAKSYDDDIKFLGQYNFNNDKSTESVFGFCDIDDEQIFSAETWNYDINIQTENKDYTLDGMLDKYMTCVETLDNGNVLANFTEIDYIDKDGNEMKWDEIWDDAFEFRYPEIPEEPDSEDYEGGKDSEEYKKDLEEYYNDLKKWENRHLKPFKHFCKWINSTRWCDVNGNILPNITTDEAIRRKEKFNNEKWEHLDVWKIAAYYIYVMRFGAVDQIVKNSMLTSEGPFAKDRKGDKYGYWDSTDEESENYGQFYKWYYINYDNDTIMGVKNDGSLVYGPEITRTSVEGVNNNPIYAGSTSVLWNNLDADEDFQQIVRIADQGISQILTYKSAINMFDVEQVGKWCERMYNKDAEYKYISPYVADWKYEGDDENADVFSDKLFMLQGSRTAHRRWWLSKRFNLFDGRWGSGDFPKKYVEVKCDYASIGDKFNAVAGANAYFGYQINNRTFGSPEGGVTTEYKIGETVNWELKKNVQIGDPIALYGAIDMIELNLMGLSKNLREVNFQFGVETDNENKLERLIVSVPDELLNIKVYYDTYTDEETGKTGFELLTIDYPKENLKIEDFQNGGKYYNPNNIEYDATDKNSPKFYRLEIVENDNTSYIYFAKKDEGVRNSSCKGITLSKLKNLQTLKMAGYVGISKLDLTNNLFISALDVRYSKIGSVAFSEGSRIKEFWASDALTSLNFNSCDSITLDNIKINDESLEKNNGINISTIEVSNSVGLNHDNSFKDFILKWMKGGPNFKVQTNEKSLSLTNVNWEDVTVNDLKDIMTFSNIVMKDKCKITGEFSMSSDNITQDDYEYLKVFKTKFNNVTINIPYPNILAKDVDDIVAGEEVQIGYDLLADDNIIIDGAVIDFKFVKEVGSEYQGESDVIFDSSNGKYYKFIEDLSEIRQGTVILDQLTGILRSEEIVLNEDTNILIAILFTYEGSRKFDITSFTINDPTYAKNGFINGENSMHEKGKIYEYNLNLYTDSNKKPIGTIYKNWILEPIINDELNENPFDYIESSAITNDNNTLTLKLRSDITPEKIANFKIKVEVRNYNENYGNFIVEKSLSILNENIIITDTSNKIVMDILYKNGFSNSEYFITKEEVGKINNIGTIFSGITKENWNFEEFIYFTGVTSLSNSAFEGSNLISIKMPNTIKSIGTSIFKDCVLLENISISESINTITEYMFFNCKNLLKIYLPKSITLIGSNSFGGVGIEKILFNGKETNTNKVLYIYEDSELKTINNNSFEETSFKVENKDVITTNLLNEISLSKNVRFSDSAYNYLLSKYLEKINISELNTAIYLEDNVLYANKGKDVLVRALPISDNEKIETLAINSTFIYPYAFYKCNSIESIILGNVMDAFGLGIGAFYDSYISKIDLSACVKLKSINNYTFFNMPNLETILFPQNGSLKEFGYYIFGNSKNLKELILPNTVNKFNGIGGSYSYFITNCGIENFKLPNLTLSTPMYLVNGCSNLKEFIYSPFFNVTGVYALVSSCRNLENIKLPIFSRTVQNEIEWYIIDNSNNNKIVAGYYNTENEAYNILNSLDNKENCSIVSYTSGTSIVINNNFYTKGRITTFENCENVKTFELNEYDDAKTFAITNDGVDDVNNNEILRKGHSVIRLNIDGSKSLVKVAYSVSNYKTPSYITLIEDGAFSHNNLEEIELHDNLVEIGDFVFYSTKLTNVIMSKNVKIIGKGAFGNCINLTGITLTNSIEVLGKGNINYIEGVFEDCINLAQLTIPENVNIISGRLCFNCKNLSKVEILGRNISKIDTFAFNGCSNLSEIIICSIIVPDLSQSSEMTEDGYYKYHPFGFNNGSFVGNGVLKDKIKKLYVPLGLKSDYESDEKWKKPLLDSKACNFIIEENSLNGIVTLNDSSLSNYALIYTSINSNYRSVGILNNGNGIFEFVFNGDVYDNEEIIIYEDSERTKEIGRFIVRYGQTEYKLDNIVLGVNNVSLFNTNLFNIEEEVIAKHEMANISKIEYEMILAKLEQLSRLVNLKK